MIYHSIRVQMKADAPQEQVDAALEQLRKMGREIPAVQSWAVGRDIGGDFDYGAQFVLKDLDGYLEYMHSPIHRKVDEIGLPIVENMISTDLTDDDDPAIGDKIREIHVKRFEGDPELLTLVEGLDSYSGSGVPGTTGK
ncbi:Dabb family protein [Kribbella sp. NBC_01245]|uniref:Dabb family protein n=1 Tax=Kribbella sp. NBC_01245 TaxID=2903578 RepID=UPI002E2C5454|nr:Dabb family protein [Kribbella sp. NBC_01245]